MRTLVISIHNGEEPSLRKGIDRHLAGLVEGAMNNSKKGAEGGRCRGCLGSFSFDLTEQLSFYGAYHSNPWNQLIHVIFVPIIWFTFGVLLWYTGELVDPLRFLPRWLFTSKGASQIFDRLDGSLLFYLAYASYYICLDKVVGTSCSVVYYLLYRCITPFVHYFTPEMAWKIALALHVFAWYMQLHPGHVIFEKRKPALMDSFFQSLVLAPLFVWYEVLFFCGYNGEYKKELDAIILERKKQMDFSDKNRKEK